MKNKRTNAGVQEEFFTTEDTEFHGGKEGWTKTPCSSVYSVVNSYLLDTSNSKGTSKNKLKKPPGKRR